MLPHFQTEAELDAWVADAPAVQAALVGVGAHLGLPEAPARYSGGSLPVAAYGDRVVKLFPPSEGVLARTEAAALEGLDGALPVPTPRPLGATEIDGWTAVVMSRLEGRELADVWVELQPGVRADLGRQVGEMAAAMHAVPAPLEVPRLAWADWVEQRTSSCAGLQAKRGAPASLVADIPRFLREADLHEGSVGWLHTEIMLEHLLVVPAEDGWRLSGVFDFEPSWVGPVDYELPSLALFVARGEPTVLRAVLEGMGAEPHAELARRILAMTLMHRYCNLAWYARQLGMPSESATLDAVAEAWFSVE